MSAPEIFMLDGRPVTASEMAEMCGVTRHAIFYRIHRMGLTPEEAVRMPCYSKARYTLGGVRMLGREIEKELNYCISVFYYRARKNGTSVQEEIDREYERLHSEVQG